MRTSDSLIPYTLMSMHPLMHGSLLLSGSILLATNYENFYQIEGTCPEGTEAQDFILGYKFTLMNLAMAAHAICLVSHWLWQLLNHYEFRVFANLFLMLKMFVYFVSILTIQQGIDFTECSTTTDNSSVMAWLTYEVLAFYLNIISLGVFIFIQNIKKFRSIRDRLGLAGQQRKNTDFLVYAKDDIYWWSAWFTQVVLCVLALKFRQNVNLDIKWSVIEVFTKHLLGAFLIRQLYFNSKFQFKNNTKVALGLSVIVNFLLIFRYMTLKKENSIWWGPIVLQDIVLYSLIFAQMFQEYMTWSQKQLKWRQDLMFDQMYRKGDNSEGHIRTNIESIIVQIEEEGLDLDDSAKIKEKLPLDESMSVKKSKTMAIKGTTYSLSYFAFMKDNKKKHNMTESDQFDIFWKAMFILAIQIFFIACILEHSKVKFELYNNVPLQFALIFTTLLLHAGQLDGARSGLYMMKYALCHPEKFTHPHLAFGLGFIQITTVFFTEFLNIAKASQRKNANELIVGYVGFSTIMNVPNIYFGSLNHIPVKGDVGKVTATKGRKDLRSDEEKMMGQGVFNFIYVMNKWFYNTYYFYFFTFSVIALPFTQILYTKETM